MVKVVLGYTFREPAEREMDYWDCPDGTLFCSDRDDVMMLLFPTGELREVFVNFDGDPKENSWICTTIL